MGLIVQKFGGSSVKDRDRIFNVARIVMNTRNAGNDVVVVVSAQGDTTDDLIAKAAEITSDPSHREMDMLLAAGEEISISLLTMALQELGVSAISLTGWQAGFNTANTQISTCEQQVKAAHDSYDQEKNYSNLLNKSQNVEDSATKLEQAQRTPDNLETLRSTLEDCTLTATMDGTITALNATVGSVCSGTVATIQNTDALVVDVTIPANSVPKLSTGMTCHITSDATGDAVIDGTLTQIDPVANDTGSFGAKVVVNGDADGLLIGISAKVEIVISEKDNVFIVPRDAVGTADDGSSYVLRKTGGEGVDMTFEQVTVTTGDTNDFYVEITGSDLQEGDVIRSSADLTQGIETSSDSTLPDGVQQMENGDLYVGDPSNMPEGTVVMGGGDVPAGGPDSGPGGGQ